MPSYQVLIGDRFRAALLALSPTGLWALDEASGATANDRGSGNHDGTISGSPTMGVTAPHGGRAIRFDGSDDLVTLASVAASTTTFTIASWFTPDTSQADTLGTILQELFVSGLFYDVSSGKLNYRFGGVSHVNNTALTNGVPVFVVFSVAAGAGSYYLNGVADGAVSSVPALTPSRIGASSSSLGRLKGTLSDVAYWSGTALSGAQASALYDARQARVRTEPPSLRIYDSLNRRSTCTFQTPSLDGSYRVGTNADVFVNQDGVRIWGGLVESADENGFGDDGVTPIWQRVHAVSFAAYASRRYVTETFVSGTLKSYLQQVEPYLAPYGVSLDASQVDGPTMDPDEATSLILTELLDRWASQSGYTWEIDRNKVLRMTAPGSTVAPFDITTANRKARGDATVERSQKDYANLITVKAGEPSVVVKTDVFTGDGVTDTFALTYSQGANLRYVDVDGVQESIYIDPLWGYTPTSITRTAGAPANGAVITFPYYVSFPISVMAEDSGEQAENGIVEKVRLEPNLYDKAVAQAIANAMLAAAIEDAVIVRYRTTESGIYPGMTQTINLAARGVSATFIAQEVETVNTLGNSIERHVTALEGTTPRPDLIWHAAFKTWAGSDANASSASTTVIEGPPGAPGTDGAPGSPGTDGTNGTIFHLGSGVPGGGTGADGDMYVDIATLLVYGPKAGGSWGSAVARWMTTGGFTGSIWAAAVSGGPTITEFSVANGQVQ